MLALGAVARPAWLAINGGIPIGFWEWTEQIYLGAVWCVFWCGLWRFVTTWDAEALLIGGLNVTVLIAWDVAVQWPLAAYFASVTLYSVTAAAPAAIGVFLTAMFWNKFFALGERWRSRGAAVLHRKWHTGLITIIVLAILWGGVWGRRASATSVIKAMGGSARSQRISGVFSLGITWRACWVDFEATDFDEQQWNQLISQLRRLSLTDYRVSLGNTNLDGNSRKRFMKRLAWTSAHVNIRSRGLPKQ